MNKSFKTWLIEKTDIFDPKRDPYYDKRQLWTPEDDKYDFNYNPEDTANASDDEDIARWGGKTGSLPHAQIGNKAGRKNPGEKLNMPPGFHDPNTPENNDHMTAGEIYADIQAKLHMGEDLTPEEEAMLDLFRNASIKHGKDWKNKKLGDLN